MVCSKCQKALKKTELATPGVKRKNEMYLGSPTAEKSRAATNGVSKAGLTQASPLRFTNTPADMDPSITEQTSEQSGKEPIRRLLELV